MQLLSRELLPREDKTITESVTITVNQTFTEHVNTTIFSTFFSTRTVTLSKTVDHTTTALATTTVQAAAPPPEVMSIWSSQLSLHRSSTIARVAPSLAPAQTDVASPAATPVASEHKSHLGSTQILALVLGAVAFAGLLVAGAFFSRRWNKKYRAQRVERKRAQTEGNQMPAGIKRMETGTGNVGFQHQLTPGDASPYFTQHATGGSNTGSQHQTAIDSSANAFSTFQHHDTTGSRGPRDENKDRWEEFPPSYKA